MRYAFTMGNALKAVFDMASNHAVMEATAGWTDYDWMENDYYFDYEPDSPCIARALGEIQHFTATFYPGE
jgi:hypothetical protein